MLDDLISYIKSSPTAWFATRLQVAQEARRQQSEHGLWDPLPETATR
jgi:hypothetical protein